MGKCIYIILVALLINLHGYFTCAQSTLPLTLTNLQKNAKDYPIEKVYLHMDKQFYGAGDTIWFKAYVVTGGTHQLSELSGVLDVELINRENTLIRNIKLPLLKGVTYGDFALGDTITEGNYRIRAYTNEMRNAGTVYFFDKTIRIVNAIDNNVFTYIRYSYPLIDGHQMVNADIIYSGLNGVPHVNKEVNYNIYFDNGKKISGVGMTDSKGTLHISFARSPFNIRSKANLSSTIVLDNKHIVNKIIPLKALDVQVDVQFFPESGNLVNGLTSKVAFEAIGSDGLGSDISGTITDDQNNDITSFASTHLGMGSFFITPKFGRTYKAHVTYSNGNSGIVDLPRAADKGDVMTIRTDSVNLIVNIARIGSQNITDSLTLIVDSNGEVYAQAKGQPGKSNFTAFIPKNKLPSGIVRFTLFGALGEPLNERLVFVQNPDRLLLNIRTINKLGDPQRKADFILNAQGPDGRPILGNFSIAVVDESKVPFDENAESTIFSNILLSSEIKGYIEKPNYYFAKSNKKTTDELDVLMMTQGYHRYEWKRIMSDKQPDMIYPYQKTLTITGSVDGSDGAPLSNSKLTLINTSTNLLVDTITDKNGGFRFNLDFVDGSIFSVKAGALNGNNILVKLTNSAAPISDNKTDADEFPNLNNGLEAYLQNSKNKHDFEIKYNIGNHSTILKQVNIKARLKTEKELKIERAVENSSNLNGKGFADQVVTSEIFEGKGCPTTTDCLQGKLAGITFDEQGQPQASRGRGSIRLGTKMLVFVDGILSQSGSINLVNPEDISSIEVLQSAGTTAIYGTRGANGVLIITTKHTQSFIVNKKGSSENIAPQGYYRAREFYSPRYDRTNITQIPDLRTTIYWKPIIQTDKNGNAAFDYFNADSKGPYRVVIEGIDYKTGYIGRCFFTYSIP